MKAFSSLEKNISSVNSTASEIGSKAVENATAGYQYCTDNLAESAGFAQGFEQGAQRFELMILALFAGLTINMMVGTMVQKDWKIPGVEEEKSRSWLIKIQEFTFYLSYGIVSIMFFTLMLGYGEFTTMKA